MKSLKFHLLLAFVLIAYTILLSHPAFSDDDARHDVSTDDVNDNNVSIDVEDGLVQSINSHRQGLKLSPLVKNEQVQRLADKLSDQLKSKPCSASSNFAKAIPISIGQTFTNYQDVLTGCNIDVAHIHGIILPVCVPQLVPTLVLGNYTQPPNSKYLSDSKFTSIGVDSEGDWMVVVLSAGTPQGSAAIGATPQPGATTSQGSAAGGATPQPGATSGGVGIGLEMRSGVYLMTFLLGIGLLLTSQIQY